MFLLTGWIGWVGFDGMLHEWLEAVEQGESNVQQLGGLLLWTQEEQDEDELGEITPEAWKRVAILTLGH